MGIGYCFKLDAVIQINRYANWASLRLVPLDHA